jgi:hypothetical protein
MAEGLRWRLAGDDAGQGTLFDADELLDRHFGTGEFKGIEFLHVNARRIINEVPAASRMPFRYTINAYRGCSHACSYCQSGETPILLGDGTTRRIADLREGDIVYGTLRVGNYRRYVRSEVLDHWSTVKQAWRVVLEDGTELVASGDHRFLTNRGWKHVSGAGAGRDWRPHLTVNNDLVGTGHFAEGPKDTADYRRGYLCGVVRGDATIGHYEYPGPRRTMRINCFGLALTDFEPLDRVHKYLTELGLTLGRRILSPARDKSQEVRSISTARIRDVAAIEEMMAWPMQPSTDWCRGFLAGIFDAEGSFGACIRICHSDPEILETTSRCFTRLGFSSTLEPPKPNGCRNVRLLGGLVEILRFFHTVGPAIDRKMDLEGRAIKNNARLRIVSVERLGFDIPM